MALLRARTPLTPDERLAKRHLVLQDTLALAGLFAITVLFAILTFLLFRSYSQHQKDAAARWLRRGEAAMKAGKPLAAVYALHSALAYAPGDRRTEIELAQALARAGRVQEATAYFNTLWEAEPGSGLINLQLARLALESHRVSAALQYYHASIYGTWEGDGAQRRRSVRLELVDHLLALNRFGEARDELLIAAGNASDTDVQDRLRIAELLMAAHAPADALHLYRDLSAHRPAPVEALEGAGHAAFVLGRYKTAQQYLQRAVAAEAAQNGKATGERTAALEGVRKQLDEVSRLLNLYPSAALPPRERAERLLIGRALVKRRLAACALQANGPAEAGSTPPVNGQGAEKQAGTGATGSGVASPGAAGPLAELQAQWASEPRRLGVADLVQHPDHMQAEIDLIYRTELVTSTVCGAPAGDDALLLKIAQAPEAVEQP